MTRLKKAVVAVLVIVTCLHGPDLIAAEPQPGRLTANRALEAALKRGDLSASAQALQEGADPNARIGFQTALAEAVISNNPALVALLLKAGADPNRCPRDSWCPFTAALHVIYGPPSVSEERNRLAIAALLLRAGANPNGTRNDDGMPLERAIQEGRSGIAMLLVEAGANVQPTAKGAPLEAALRSGKHKVTRRLLAAGARLAPSPELLLALAESGDPEGLEIALRLLRGSAHRARLDLPGALAAATRKDCARCAQLLLAAGARYRLHDRYGDQFITTWFELIGSAGADVLEAYAARGLNPRALGADNTTLLHLAAQAGKADSLKWLLARGLAVDATQKSTQHTALMVAAAGGKIDAVRVLLDAGASLTLHDAWGQTAKLLASGGLMETAITADHHEVVRLLQERGAREYVGRRLPPSQFDAVLAGEQQEDLTVNFYRQLPFLPPGLRFFSASDSRPAPDAVADIGAGPTGALYAVLPERKVVELARPSDLIALGLRLRSGDDALRLVRFYSEPATAHQAYLRARFASTGYWELPEDSQCIKVSGWKGSRRPSITSTKTPAGSVYTVRRFMIADTKGGVGFGAHLAIDEIVQTTESVREDGSYAVETRAIATPGLVVRNQCGER